MAEVCLVCGEGAQELECKSCSSQIHFACAYGAPVNNKNPQTYFRNGNYLCPVCIVGRKNELVLKSVSYNQTYISNNTNVVDFKLPDSFAAAPEVDVTATDEGENKGGESGGEEKRPGCEFVLTGLLNSLHRKQHLDARAVPPPVRQASTPERPTYPSDMSGSYSEDHSVQSAPLHQADLTRSKRLSMILNTFKNLPDHVRTVILGDSNSHHVRGRDVDPKDNKVCVRSSGGLCIFAAVHALKQYDKYPLKRIQRVVWSIGTNDALHGSREHCQDDVPTHIKALYSETKRIFPNASVGFILPSIGIKNVTSTFRKDLDNLIKVNCPRMKRYYPPSMHNMVGEDGVHITNEGRQAYINFLMRNFSNCKPQASPAAKPDIPASQAQVPSSAFNTDTSARSQWEGFKPQYQSYPPITVPPPPLARSVPHSQCSPAYPSLVSEIAQAVTQITQPWRRDPERQPNSYQQWLPPSNSRWS